MDELRVKAIILFQLSSLALLAQNNGSITGFVKDNGYAVEFVNVYITPANDSSKIVAAAVTDNWACFRLENVAGGKLFHLTFKCSLSRLK